jgi:O-antigen/teichoic acid export membrane protein
MRYVPSATVRSMAVYGASGLAFLGANLLLARALTLDQYALVTLVVALVTLGYHLAPIGLDGVVVRGRVDTGPALLKRVAAAAAAVGAGMTAAAFAFYGIAPATAALLLPASVAGALMLVAAARFQAEQRFGLSLTLIASPNLLLLLGAAVTLALGQQTALVTLLVLTLGLVASAVFGWTIVLRDRAGTVAAKPAAVPWAEAAALAGMSAAGMLFIQLERLVIPHLLPPADLALFGVLAAIAGSLFRLLQMGVGFSLLPRLRNAATVLERRRLIAHEARFAVVIAVAGAIGVLVATPPIERWLLADKYDLSTGLLVAALFSGVAKIAHAFAKVAATALGTQRELARANGAGWVSVVLAIGAASLATPWGLTGVVYGVGIGWLAWAAMMLAVVYRHLRMPVGVPAET